jgi:PEP-CTERM motif
MSFLSKNAALLVALSIAVVGFSNIANATPFGVSEIAKNHDLPLNEGAKNHGAVVSEAAKQQGGAKQGGLGSLNYQGTFSPQNASSPQSVPEAGTLLLFGAGLLGLAVWRHRSRRGLVE